MMPVKFRFIDRADLAKVQSEFESACHASRFHSELAAESLGQYGSHGADISGCVREHFPADVKDHLRRVAKAVSYHVDRAYAARPKRIRTATIVRLGQEIATRDGCGFYGPAKIIE